MNSYIGNLLNFPVEFNYNGKHYSGFKGFEIISETEKKLHSGTEKITVLKTAEINAVFKLLTRDFPKENACEFALYIENNTDKNTGIFDTLEYKLIFDAKKPHLSGLEGDGGISWHKAVEVDFEKQPIAQFRSLSGRPTHHVFPYYNLSFNGTEKSDGVFLALGWPGTWHESFVFENNTITLFAGQNDISTYIAPGETFRMPLMAIVEYKDTERWEQTNVWRHYFINNVLKKDKGELPKTLCGISRMSEGQTTDSIMALMKQYEDHGIKLETMWMDAGWYTGAEGETVSWPNTGTQEIDTSRFPDRFSTIGKYCKDRDIEFLLWFEPEDIRLDKEKFLKKFPEFKEEWLLTKTMVGTWLEGYLFDMGNKEAVDWLLGRVSSVIESSGLTIYRQDFNSDPASAWHEKDAADRKGTAENQYVQGYLRYWDTLLEKYPYLKIDSCASGGGRNDLESMKRAVPLHYSDLFDGSGDQNNLDKTRMTQSLFAWFPYFKNQMYSVTKFTSRMNYAAYSLFRMPLDNEDPSEWDKLKKVYEEYNIVRGFLFDDYYQLTEYSEEKDRWNGWEFFNKETNKGFCELLCNTDCTQLTKTFNLYGLDDNVIYHLTDFDGLVDITKSGKELKEDGITVTVESSASAVIILIN